VLLLVVNPTASHALARAAYKTGVPMWHGAVRDEVVERKERAKAAAARDKADAPARRSDGGGEG
jgi:hypothetical protein